jgi:hypothetical protein
MVGRAGRPGFSSISPNVASLGGIDPASQSQGESYLLVKKHEKQKAISLIRQPLPCVFSQMHPKNDGGRGLLKAILEMYGLSLCESFEDVQSYVRNTLLWYQAKVRSDIKPIQSKPSPNDIDMNVDSSLLLTSNYESNIIIIIIINNRYGLISSPFLVYLISLQCLVI